MASLYFQRDLTEGAQAAELQAQINQTNQEWNQFLNKIGQKRVEINLGRKRQEDQKSSKYFFRRYNAIPGSTTSCMTKVGMS